MKDQIVYMCISSESGCDILQDEFSMTLLGMFGCIDFTERGGESDCDLIREAVYEWINENTATLKEMIDQEFEILLQMSERTEREDVFTNKWFEVDEWKFSNLIH